jgi:hypothetical protein
MVEQAPPWPKQGPASYFPSIEKKYGRPIAEWQQIIAGCGLEKHMAIVGYLKSEHGMGARARQRARRLDARRQRRQSLKPRRPGLITAATRQATGIPSGSDQGQLTVHRPARGHPELADTLARRNSTSRPASRSESAIRAACRPEVRSRSVVGPDPCPVRKYPPFGAAVWLFGLAVPRRA